MEMATEKVTLAAEKVKRFRTPDSRALEENNHNRTEIGILNSFFIGTNSSVMSCAMLCNCACCR